MVLHRPFEPAPTYRELTRNRWVGQRERGLHESFSLVSPYSSVSKPRGGFPLINGKRIPYMGGSATQNLHCFSVGGSAPIQIRTLPSFWRAFVIPTEILLVCKKVFETCNFVGW